MISIVIIDRQETFCNCIKEALLKHTDFEICGSGKDSYDTLRLIEKHKPDIAIIEFELSGGDPLKLLVSIRARSEKTKIIYIVRSTKESDIIALAKSGVPGCIGRDSANDCIGEACFAVSVKKEYITHDLALKAFMIFSKLLCGASKNETKANTVHSAQNAKRVILTQAELNVAVCLGQGFSNKEIVKKLNLKEGTVRNYISAILKKTGLKHRTQIAIYALEGGFIHKIKHGINRDSLLDNDDDLQRLGLINKELTQLVRKKNTTRKR